MSRSAILYSSTNGAHGSLVNILTVALTNCKGEVIVFFEQLAKILGNQINKNLNARVLNDMDESRKYRSKNVQSTNILHIAYFKIIEKNFDDDDDIL